MRKLGLLGALILMLVIPSAANAAWQGYSPWAHDTLPLPTHVLFDRFNTALAYNGDEYTSADGWFMDSVDGGESWGGATELPSDGEHFVAGIDGDGNRIWAYSVSNTITVTRASYAGSPDDAKSRNFSAPRVSDLKIAVNKAGDALISWSDTLGDPGVAYWKSGDPAPGPIQILRNAYSCSGSSNPTPFLDPNGSATLAWECDGTGVNQATTVDASIPGGFGESQRLGLGQIRGGGQAADGRAVLMFDHEDAIPPNSHGLATARILEYSSRRSGMSLSAPIDLAGGGDRDFTYMPDHVAVAPSGRVLAGFSTAENIPASDNWCDGSKSLYTPESSMAIGTIDPQSGTLDFKTTVLSSGQYLTGAWVTHVAAGPDGRFALAYGGSSFCGLSTRWFGDEHILLALDGEHFEPIPRPTTDWDLMNFSTFTFTGRGQLFVTAWNAIAGPPKYDLFDTDSPLEPASHNPPAGPEPSDHVSASSSTAALRIISARASGDGKIAVTLKASSAGAVSIFARSRRATVATRSAHTPGGTSRIEFQLNRAALQKLFATGHLNAKLSIKFVPANGAAPSPVTKWVTFKRK